MIEWPMMIVGVLGLGEAGGAFAADLAAEGVEVRGYDPAGVATPPGVLRCSDPVAACEQANLVLALTSAADALQAWEQLGGRLAPGSLYADLSTSEPALKRRLAVGVASAGAASVGVASVGTAPVGVASVGVASVGVASVGVASAGVEFAGVALMSPVPGRGLRTPALVSGSGADRYAALMLRWGVPVQVVGADPGEAALRKLLRSVMMKGLAALSIEAMRGAEAADRAEWLWGHLVEEITAADEGLLRRLIAGTPVHALRRHEEMEAARGLLDELGVPSVMTAAIVETLAGPEARRPLGLPDASAATPAGAADAEAGLDVVAVDTAIGAAGRQTSNLAGSPAASAPKAQG